MFSAPPTNYSVTRPSRPRHPANRFRSCGDAASIGTLGQPDLAGTFQLEDFDTKQRHGKEHREWRARITVPYQRENCFLNNPRLKFKELVPVEMPLQKTKTSASSCEWVPIWNQVHQNHQMMIKIRTWFRKMDLLNFIDFMRSMEIWWIWMNLIEFEWESWSVSLLIWIGSCLSFFLAKLMNPKIQKSEEKLASAPCHQWSIPVHTTVDSRGPRGYRTRIDMYRKAEMTLKIGLRQNSDWG